MTLLLNPGETVSIEPVSGTLDIVSSSPSEVVVECIAAQPPPPVGENLLQYPEFAVPGMDQSDPPIPPWQTENNYFGLSLKPTNPSPNTYSLKGKLASDGAGTEVSASFPNGAYDRCWQDVTAPPHTSVTISYQEVGREGALLKILYGRDSLIDPWSLVWSAEREHPDPRYWSDVISHTVTAAYLYYRFEVYYAPVSPSGYKITNVSLIPNGV